MSHTLAELRRELARSLESYVTGFVDTADATTLTDPDVLATGQWKDNHFLGADLYIIAADDEAPQGEHKYVTAFDATTGMLTWIQPFTVDLEPGDQFELYLNATLAELNQALMFAVKDWRFMSTEQIVQGNSEYEVTCNGLMSAEQVTGVFIRDANREDDGFFPLSNYRLWEQAGIVHLEILNSSLLSANNFFRIEYLAEYNNLKDPDGNFLDTAQVGGDLNLHMLMAKRYFYDRRMNVATPIDREWYAGLLRFSTEEIEKVIEPPKKRPGRARQQNYGDGEPFDDMYGPHYGRYES